MARTAAVRLEACGCITPFGDADETLAALLAKRSALALAPVRGAEGGDRVPLALMPGRALDETLPPAWLEYVDRLVSKIGEGGWGGPRAPVIVTGSNFGVGGLYALRRTGNAQYAQWGAPATCTERLRQRLGWGPDVSTLSHACVTAHIGLLQASRFVEASLADRVLVLSFDFLSPFVAGGFHALKILNGDFPSPYRERQSGSIGLGDGLAYAIVSNKGSWSLSAQSVFNEMHHFTSNKADGSGFDACLGPVFEAVKGRRVWYKGHGTGTLEAGRLEVAAVQRRFPDIPIVGWKGSLGHTLGSCGLVELAITVAAMQAGRIPATVGAEGPLMAPNVAVEEFGAAHYDAVVCASNAFGGAHAAFLLSHD